MKKTLTQAIILFIAFITTVSLQAQVTIGSTEVPMKGALLDLTQGANTSKGLSLPRVALSNLKPLTDVELAQSIGNATGSYDMNDHIGLIVYNIDPPIFNNTTCKWQGQPLGLYVWDGSEWQSLGKRDDPKGQDVRTITDDGSSITISYNGETTNYHYSSFGAAGTWMTENLATKYFPDGTLISKHTDNSYTDPQYYIPYNLTDTDPLINITAKYGLLYNWPAAMADNDCISVDQGQVAGNMPGANEVEVLNGGSMQGICPKGWHLPSDREWNELEKEITENADNYSVATYTPTQKVWNSAWETTINYRGSIAGTVMKTVTPLNGTNPNGTSKLSSQGGFDVPLIGRAENGAASYYGALSSFWSASSNSSTHAWYRYLEYNRATIYRNGYIRYIPLSVRCKKD